MDPCATSPNDLPDLSLQLRQGPMGVSEPQVAAAQGSRLIEVERSVSVGLWDEGAGGGGC